MSGKADLVRMQRTKTVVGRWSFVGGRWLTTNDQRLTPLLAVQLDNQLLVHRQLDIFALGQVQHLALVIVAIDFQPARHGAVAREFLRQLKHRELLAVFANRDFLAGADFVGRNIHLAVIDSNVSMADQLTSLTARLGESEAEHDVIETPLELLQQPLAGHALSARSLFEVVAELAFLGEVDALGLLLLAQLQAVAYDLGLAIFPVLSGGEIALLDGALIAEALGAFEEQLHALAAA